MIGRGQRTAQSVAGSVFGFHLPKDSNGLIEPPLEKPLDSREWNVASRWEFGPRGEMELIDRVQKKESTNSVVEVFAIAAKQIEDVPLREEGGIRQIPA